MTPKKTSPRGAKKTTANVANPKTSADDTTSQPESAPENQTDTQPEAQPDIPKPEVTAPTDDQEPEKNPEPEAVAPEAKAQDSIAIDFGFDALGGIFTSVPSALRDLNSVFSTDEVITQAQKVIRLAIDRAVSSKNEADTVAFVKAFHKIYNYYVDELESDIFTPKKIFRQVDKMDLTTTTHGNFTRLYRVLVDTAPEKTRHEVAKTVAWSQLADVLTYKNSEEVVQRLKAHFNVD